MSSSPSVINPSSLDIVEPSLETVIEHKHDEFMESVSSDVAEPGSSSSDVVEPVSSSDVVEPVSASSDVVEPVSASSSDVLEPVSVSSSDVVDPVSSSDVVEPVSSSDVVEPVSSSVVNPVSSSSVVNPVSSGLVNPASLDVVERVSSDVTEPKSAVVEITSVLIDLINSNLDLPNYRLTQDQKKWIKLMITNSPNSFVKIDKVIESVLANDNISIQIIPQLVQLFADVYNSTSIQLDIQNHVNIYVFVKFTLYIILDSSFILIPDVTQSMITSMVNVSLSLLTTNLANGSSNNSIPVVSTKCCFF
jgi:hypothetical protein